MISDDIAYKLHALVYSIDREASKLVKQHSSINYPQFLIMLCFYQNPGQTQKFAANWLQLTEATISHMVKNLAVLGLLQLRKDVKDSRVNRVMTTNKGTKTVEYIYPKLTNIMEASYMSLGSKRVEQFSETLDELHKLINKGDKCE